MWTCPKCSSKVDPTFEVCWNCGTTPEGVEDPSFVKADDAEPIFSDPVVPQLDIREDAPIASDLPEPALDLVEAYQAMDGQEAKFLVDQLGEAGIRAVTDTHDMHEFLGTFDGSPRVWVRSEDFAKARTWLEAYERNKGEPTVE